MGEVKGNHNRTEEFLGTLASWLNDFCWMSNEVERLQDELFSYRLKVSYGVAQYGIEMTLPNGSSGKSKYEMAELETREAERVKRFWKMKNQIDMVEHIALIEEIRTNYELATIYELLLSGSSQTLISDHMKQDRRTIKRKIDEIYYIAIQNETIETFLLYGVVDKFE